jgi:metal-sulfur cluster biosynthetic enzyme
VSTAAAAVFGVQIDDALRTVIDPELGHNVLDLGLIYDVSVADGTAQVIMTTTTRGCPATNYLKQGVHESVSSVPGITAVEVTLTYEPPWTPMMMSDDAKEFLGITDDSGW